MLSVIGLFGGRGCPHVAEIMPGVCGWVLVRGVGLCPMPVEVRADGRNGKKGKDNK